jgi:hypothetical protein
MPQDTDLRMAEGNVCRGEINVVRQRKIIKLKESREQDTELSERILRTLEVSLALHHENLDQLRRAATPDKTPPEA